MNKLNCVKCNQQYESLDPDPYYCSSCEKAKKVLAKDIDLKFANRPPTPHKPTLDELPRIPGTNFINAKYLGL